jgi:hypothetical protein
LLGRKKKNENEREEKRKQSERFYLLLKALMDELFEHASKSKHIKLPYNTSFGLIYDQRDAILLTGTDSKTGRKMYLYNVRIIGKSFEEKREQMLADNTAQALFQWIGEVCSMYLSPFVYEYVVNKQHRGNAAADRTTRQVVRGFLDKLVSDPELEYILDILRNNEAAQGKATNS